MSRRITDPNVVGADVLRDIAPNLHSMVWPKRAIPQRWTASVTPKGQTEARAVEDLLTRAAAAADQAARSLRQVNADRDLSETGRQRRRAAVLQEAAAEIRADLANTLKAFEARRLQVDADVAAARRATVDAAATPDQRREIRDVLRSMDRDGAKRLVDAAVRGESPDVAAALLDTPPAIRAHLEAAQGIMPATWHMIETAIPVVDQGLVEMADAHRHAAEYVRIYGDAATSLDRRIGELTAAIGEESGAA